ncbi:MAG TPA: hypothetical protein VJL29_10900 [Thermoguttaceae bacterium]|nr:hypothetical protein [Thermoguttaceae bacterium]
MSDKIIDEIRKIRDDYARQCNYDLHTMCEDLRREQERSGAAVVSLPKKPAQVVPCRKGDTRE